jgi:succinate dehydrogenase / fumarate reductase cytochrome b subunit
MRAVADLYSTSVGKKIAMAVTGLVLVAFVIGHMIGNLKVFLGPDAFDHYAHGLRTLGDPILGYGQALWIVRLVLLGCVGVHMMAAWQTWRLSSAARTMGYRRSESVAFSYASSTMRWGGVIIAAFVVYHILHLTTGTVHPRFGGSAYENLVSGFKVPLVAAAYILAMIPLALHLYHGIWSACQTLDIDNRSIRAMRRPVAAAIAAAVFAGFISVPVAVIAGLVG